MLLPLLGLFTSDPLTFGPGTSPEFQDAVREVVAAKESGDKARATRLLSLLPVPTVYYRWDDKAIPAAQRDDYAKARDRAFHEWLGVSHEVRFLPSASASLSFGFAPKLAARPKDANPLGVAIFFNGKATPRMEAVIGLKRGLKGTTISSSDMLSAVRYSLSRYFGLSEETSGVSRRPDLPGDTVPITNSDLLTVRENLAMVNRIRTSIKEDKPLQAGTPRVVIDPMEVEIGTVTQGDKVPFTVQISNTGTAPLSYRTQGDCGCVVGTPPGVLPPGGVALLRPHINSTEYTGKLVKALIVTTNDPDKPTITIPVKLSVTPMYRFLMPSGSTILLDETKKKEVFLVFADGREPKVLQVRFNGIPIRVTQEPWEGELPDPAMNEPSKKRKGIKFDLEIDGDTIPGRNMGSLTVITDSEVFRLLTATIYAQRGIASTPEDLYLGVLGNVVKRGSVLVMRPSKPFKILSVESDNPHLKPSFEAMRPDEYKLQVEYDGKLTSGELNAKIRIKTDDPKQSEVIVPVRGFVS